ncbi:unnamed protein product [Protopolystoma xenopodis]|uniref:Uncharacterized protein n=1 Tax=Protopolystoma xenopodis TaxID=117903 RepID=A0A3S5AUZ8_9PLAT|nr:unnamed protein product [Protopolystoma xenopodis]
MVIERPQIFTVTANISGRGRDDVTPTQTVHEGCCLRTSHSRQFMHAGGPKLSTLCEAEMATDPSTFPTLFLLSFLPYCPSSLAESC